MLEVLKFILLYFSLFITYSFIGWIIEMITENIFMGHKFANRGFLIGPYCPIYGFASIIMIILLSRYSGDILVLFFMSLSICTIVEYFTSFLLEKIFKARWWDYTDRAFNINGRVCLINTIGFGLLGILLIEFMNPFILGLFNGINQVVFYIVVSIIFILFCSDVIISFNIIKNVKVSVANLKKDYTNEFYNSVRAELTNKKFFTKRIFKAFPNLKSILSKSKIDKNN
ncbi:MAG: putative ABC transporter permease [Clostridium sp.]|nr:putative ABC transporter permease [Clostridium sp.]MCM1443895.1 putative ABC transporter permease [Candidatus Amulumruptor caecigallinarius]